MYRVLNIRVLLQTTWGDGAGQISFVPLMFPWRYTEIGQSDLL